MFTLQLIFWPSGYSTEMSGPENPDYSVSYAARGQGPQPIRDTIIARAVRGLGADEGEPEKKAPGNDDTSPENEALW